MVGTKNGIITALEVEEKNTADCPRLQPLMNQTAQQFKINDLCRYGLPVGRQPASHYRNGRNTADPVQI